MDEWVIYDPFKNNALLTRPQRAVILYVYKESERSMYDYEIYIDEEPGIYKKVLDRDLHYPDS